VLLGGIARGKPEGGGHMILVAVGILTVWCLSALTIGLIAGAVIRTAEKLRHDQYLTSVFAILAGEQVSR
jgi:hypothetical protein